MFLNLNQLKKLYLNAPTWMQRLYTSIPYEIRNGTEYQRWIHFLDKEINQDEYSLLKLKETIFYAYENTQYYKRIFDEKGISPYDLHTQKDLEALPYLTKKIIQENFDDLLARNYPEKKQFYVRTGGSTGYPQTFYQSKNIWQKEQAFVQNFFSKFQYNPKILKAKFMGGDFKSSDKNDFFTKDYINNAIHFSPLHLSTKTVSKYVEVLNHYQPIFFHSYPSTLLFLIRNMINQNIQLNYQIKTIFLVSEGYEEEDIQTIKHFFNCTIASFYGQSERIIFATSMDQSLQSFHIDKRYGNFELIDNSSSKTIKNEGIQGTIVGTSFDNFAMPLIRYRSDDMTTYLNYREGIISKIESLRNQVYIDGIDDLKIAITSFPIAQTSMNIHQWQILQKKPGEIELLIVPKIGFSHTDEIQITSVLEKKFKGILKYKIVLVNKPYLTPRGKTTRVIKKY